MNKYNAHNSLLPFLIAHQLEIENSANRHNLCFSYLIENEKSVSLLIDTLQELIRSQAHLRQTFNLKKDEIIGNIHKNLPAEVHYYTSSLAEIAGMEQVLIREQHDLANKSSIRLNLIKISDENKFMALFNIHHIIMDGNSLEQFISDINQLIAGKEIAKETASAYISRCENERSLESESALPGLSKYLEMVQSIADDMTFLEGDSKSAVLYNTKILLYSAKAAEKKLTLSFSCDSQLPHFVIGDKVRLHGVLCRKVRNFPAHPYNPLLV